MRRPRVRRWYGAGPLHLLALAASFLVAGYAAARLLSARPLAVVVWFAAGVVGHDLVLLPLYTLADRPLADVARRRRAPTAVPWANHVRVPAALSLLLLAVWFPLILRLSAGSYERFTGRSADPFLWHWLLVSGALFAGSAVVYALRLRRYGRRQEARQRSAASDGGGG